MQENKAEFWKAALEQLSHKLPKAVYDTIIRSAIPDKLENNKLTLVLPFNYMLRRIQHTERIIIQNVITEILGRDICVEFLVFNTNESIKSTKLAIDVQNLISKRKDLVSKPGTSSKDSNGSSKSVSPNGKIQIGRLINTYTFDQFIVGDNNLMANAAAVAVSTSPGQAYNPLFIYGGVGLGKTHLLHAIGHSIKKENPEKLIRVCSAETYTNELIDAIGDKQESQRFRAKYRRCDVLLIDDIHFLIDKEATQEAFFHTFNVLHELGKQIVLTSDRHPSELRTLKERLINRFQLGLIVDIRKPSYETRLAILRKKAESMGLSVADEILGFYAEEIQGSIRSLEGCLKATSIIMSSLKRQLTLDDAHKIAKDYSDENSRNQQPLTLKSIMSLISHHYRISHEELCSKSRESHIAHPRHIGMYLARKHTTHSFKEIARAFHKKDHGTVYHAVKKIENSINLDSVLAREIAYIQDMLLGKSPIE